MLTLINKYTRVSHNFASDYHLCEESPKLGKMSGTMLGGLMGESRWDTPFTIAQKLLRIYSEDTDSPAMAQGRYLEPIILNYLDATGRLPNTPAEALFPHYEEGDHLDWKSHFDDDVFSGHIDAIAGHVTDAKQGIGIVENKTTTHPEQWDWGNNIPPKNYWLQASLYAHFFGYSDIYFTVGILTPDEQSNPALFVPREDNVRIMHVGLYPEFDEVLDYAREWYSTYIACGRTPMPNPKSELDMNLVHILDQQIAEEVEILPILHEYTQLKAKQSELEKQTESLKKQITAYLDAHNLDGIEDATGRYTYKSMVRKSVDTDQMKQDGIYNSYLKEISYKMFKKA